MPTGKYLFWTNNFFWEKDTIARILLFKYIFGVLSSFGGLPLNFGFLVPF